MSSEPRHRGEDVSFERQSRRRGLVERYVDSVNSRVGGGSMVSKVLHKVFPNHFSFLWGEVALYSFVVIVVTGIYLTLFFEGSQEEVDLPRLVPAAAGRRGVRRLRLGAAHLLRREGRAADPPDAPLGGTDLRRRHLAAHGAGVLHRRLPPPTRAQLGRRRAAADPRPRRRVHRLLATRRPAVGHRGCASPMPSSSPSRSSASVRRTCCSVASGRAPTSSVASTRSTS